MADDEYKITDEDILAVMKYLRFNYPEFATPENAKALLSQYRNYFKIIDEFDSELLQEILIDLEEY